MSKLLMKVVLLFLVIVSLVLCWYKIGRQAFINHIESELVFVTMEQVMAGEPIKLDQDDETITSYIWKKNLILPPSAKEYNLIEPKKDSSRGQSHFIRRLLKNMTNGFFVEAGALDGETRSNTLFMEKHLNWKGLLVEGDPKNFKTMKTKNRKAWISNTCLAVKSYPHTAEYLQSFNTGKIVDSSPEKMGPHRENTTKVQCMPLYSLLKAINVSTIDYFSLDVEGSELKVLQTIPFDKIFIKTLSIEFEHTNGGKLAILKFMQTKGYVKAGEITPPAYGWANDIILIHKSVRNQRFV